jgi:hypothetical protein
MASAEGLNALASVRCIFEGEIATPSRLPAPRGVAVFIGTVVG